MCHGPRRSTDWPQLPAYNGRTLANWELVLCKKLTFVRSTNVYYFASQGLCSHIAEKPCTLFLGLFSPLDATEAVYPAENAGAVYQTLDIMPLFWQEASTAHEHLLTMYAQNGTCLSLTDMPL
jgi:hypothetical protein